jgi:hypothetical protein
VDVSLLQTVAHWTPASHFNLDSLNDVSQSGLLLAQAYKEDILGNIGKAWDNFIRTGQVWALVVGFVIGYIFRSITSY